ncbi:MAG TPA: nucleoside monophosphate kinase [Chlamydiales bacterium]|nr:nucleoside monophosphate kinase [Chlamydiales bacterium]
MLSNLIGKIIIIILIGQPGAGKSSLAYLLKKQHKISHITTGEMLLEHVGKKTPLGKIAESHIFKGELLPDHLVNNMLFDYLDNTQLENCIVLDGYPRSLQQAKSLQEKFKDQAIILAVDLNVPDEKIYERIQGRLRCKNCKRAFHKTFFPPKNEGICDDCQGQLFHRKDDDIIIFKQRLKEYHKSTSPLLEYYWKQNTLLQLTEGNTPMENYFELLEMIRNFNQEN